MGTPSKESMQTTVSIWPNSLLITPLINADDSERSKAIESSLYIAHLIKERMWHIVKNLCRRQ